MKEFKESVDKRKIEKLLEWKEWMKEYRSWSEEKKEKWIMDRWKGEKRGKIDEVVKW